MTSRSNLAVAALLLTTLAGPMAPAADVAVTVDPNDTGRTFEGVGAVSAGASTRNLVDYPIRQRDEVLDYLFKPKFGAGLQHLKVEIGGGENSTCGSEPSHAIRRDELKDPRARGYEFWLMAEARKRNPAIQLDCLPWSYPGWISGRFSQDSADWFTAFLDVAKRDYGLQLNWVAAAQNEMGTDVNWVVNTLRPTLDAHGFSAVQLQAPDDIHHVWEIYDRLAKNPAANQVIKATGYHYLSDCWPNLEYNAHPATTQALASGKSLWASEEFGWSGREWDKAMLWARILNKNYIQSRVTKNETWGPVDGIYPGIRYAGTGLMGADEPWSGHYEVWPGIWTTAHTTQFAEPGWRYLDHACGQMDPRTWKGSYVTLMDPRTKDWSMIVCTDAKVVFDVRVADGLKPGPIHVWKSDAKEQFVQLADVAPKDGIATIALDGDSLYSFTTSTGQQKGARPAPPPSKSFPFPYSDNFDSYAPGQTPRYFSDQKGTFETAKRPDGDGICLKQIVPSEGIQWMRDYRLPHTVLGSDQWRDYSVQTDVQVTNGSVEVGGRFADGFDEMAYYSLALKSTGQWSLAYHQTKKAEQWYGTRIVKSAQTNFGFGYVENFKSTAWHNLRISFAGTKIVAWLDGQQVAEVTDGQRQSGLAYIASSYDPNCFDDVSITPN